MLSALCQVFREESSEKLCWGEGGRAIIKRAEQKKTNKTKPLLTLAKKLLWVKLKYRYCPHGKNVGKVSRQIVNIWPYSALYNITVHRSSFRPLAGGGQRACSTCIRRRTFARGGATVVLKVRTVFALVVLWAGAVVVCGQVEADCSILTRVGQAVINIQLWKKRFWIESNEPDSWHSFCYRKQSKTHSILPTNCARKQHTHSAQRRGGGGRRARDIGPVLWVWASALRNVSHCSQEQLQQSTPFLKKEDCGTTAV